MSEFETELKRVTTRKPHICLGCAREIPAGTVMDSWTYSDGEHIERLYMCAVCTEFNRGLPRHVWDDGVYEGGLTDYDPELWEQTRARIEQ